MAKAMSSRKTQLEQWDQPDPNRKMTLEETPWLREAKGGKHRLRRPYIKAGLKDCGTAKRHRSECAEKAQTSLGAFPVSQVRHRPTLHFTFYTDFPKRWNLEWMCPKTWSKSVVYMHRHYIDEVVKRMIALDSGWEWVTFINYVPSNYPDTWTGGVFTDEDRKKMIDFRPPWKEHTPYLKGYLASHWRMARPADAKLVWESVMDSAKTAEDQGHSGRRKTEDGSGTMIPLRRTPSPYARRWK